MKQALILTTIIILAFFLRFWQLGEMPHGLYQDETAIGYNAYLIAQTGKDEYGKLLPLYFKSFGDYKLPLYIYTAVIPIKVFGLNEFSVRLPSAFFGFISIPIFYFFVKELTKNRTLALVTSGFLAINPWHLHYNRATFEVSLSLFLLILGGLLLLKSTKDGFRGVFFLGTLCFVLALYSYNLTRMLVFPLYFLFFVVARKGFKNISRKEFLVTLSFTLVLLAPFMVTFLQSSGLSSAKGTLIFSSQAVYAPLLELRSYLVGLPDIFTKLFFNKLSLTTWQYLNNLFGYLSIPFFFISGSSHGNHGIGNVGQLYLFELPLVVFAIYKIIKEKISWGLFLLAWGIIVILVAALTREVPHATRSFFLLIPLEVFSGLGLLGIMKWIKEIESRILKTGLILFSIFFIGYNLLFYFVSYYIRFPVLYAKSWRSADKDLSLYLKNNESKYQKIIFDNKAGFIYSSLLFYLKFDPRIFQETSYRYPDDKEGFSQVKSFDKFEFRNIDWDKDYQPDKKTLIITTLEHKKRDASLLKTFSYPKRPVVVAIKEELIQYPVEESAYVLVETP